ncbi:MAG: DUF4870 family protein [Asticcacaulis sp.]
MTDATQDPKPETPQEPSGSEPVVSPVPVVGIDGDKTLPVVTYALLLGGALSVGVLAIVALVLAYVSRDQAPDWAKSHYIFIIRTFWIGLVGSVVGLITTIIGVGVLLLCALVVWALVRCILGLIYATKGEPYPRPQNWLA